MAARWSEWQIVQLQECLVRGIGPQETAALLGKTKDDVCAKAGELGLLLSQPDAKPEQASSNSGRRSAQAA
jgi:hypothetical protein